MDPRVVIVVLNWNGRADTLACLQSLQDVVREDVEALVVDNGSTDDSVAAIRAAYPEIELIESGRNLGYAGGNNVGIERAMSRGADFVLVLNNDTTCAPDLIDRLLEAAAQHPRAGMFCPRIFLMHEPTRVCFDGARWDSKTLRVRFPGKGRPESELGRDPHETDYASGAALFVRAEVIREIGAFDDRYFLVWEETDWCYRARERGWLSMVVPAAKVWHKVGSSFGAEISPLRIYFTTRNSLVWLFRHGTPGEKARALARSARALLPRWRPLGDVGIPRLKRYFWAARDWLRSALGGGDRLEYLAKRRALFDFLAGRLGPMPSSVSRLQDRWTAGRAQSGPTP